MKKKKNKTVQKREKMRRAVIAFYHKNKKWPSSTAKDPNEMRMGMWVSRTRYIKNHHPERLPAKISELIGLIDEEKVQLSLDQWENSYQNLKSFIAENGRWPAIGSSDPNETKLYNWCSTQRSLEKKRKKDPLTQSRIDKLDAIGFRWIVIKTRTWKESFELVKAFYLKNNEWPTHSNRDPEEDRLGKWCNTMRASRNGNKTKYKLTPGQIKKLTDLGFEWTPNPVRKRSKERLDKIWITRYNEFCEFIAKEKRYPRAKAIYDSRTKKKMTNEFRINNEKEKFLYIWRVRMVGQKRKGTLSEERIQLLDSIGFWDKAGESESK